MDLLTREVTRLEAQLDSRKINFDTYLSRMETLFNRFGKPILPAAAAPAAAAKKVKSKSTLRIAKTKPAQAAVAPAASVGETIRAPPMETRSVSKATKRTISKPESMRFQLTDADIEELIKFYTDEPLEWEVIRTIKRAEIPTLRDLKCVISEQNPLRDDLIAASEALVKPTVQRLLLDLEQLGAIKAQIGITVFLRRDKFDGSSEGPDGETEFGTTSALEKVYRNGSMKALLARSSASVVEEFVRASFTQIIELVESMLQNGSGWTLDHVEQYNLRLDRYRPGRGGSHIPSPPWIVAKKCSVNIQNENDECFRYALTSCVVRPPKHAYRTAFYDDPERRGIFNFEKIDFPARCSSNTFRRFERQNPKYCLTVYDCPASSRSRDDLTPVYHSDAVKERLVLIMLYDEHGDTHYIGVHRPSALLRVGSNEEAHCLRCLYCFAGDGARERLSLHEPECRGIQNGGVQRIKMPEPGTILHFKEWEKTLAAPFVIYADFEATLIPIEGDAMKKTQQVQRHVCNSYKFIVIGPDGKAVDDLSRCYIGEDAAYKFLEEAIDVGYDLVERMQSHKKLGQLSAADEAAFQASDSCHFCGVALKGSGVRDHCHLTGRFRGAACNACNLRARASDTVPVMFHNLKGYDAHHLFIELGRTRIKKFRVIASNAEKYTTFWAGPLAFKDSAQFLLDSLENLSANLFKGLNDELIAATNAGDLASRLGVNPALLIRKGIYPYEWFDSEAKFDENELPPIEAFSSSLSGSGCSAVDYEHARKIWNEAGCKSFRDYHRLYLELDVALLADVFENFRRIALKSYGLDPAHYFTLPGFSWSAMLKMTKVELELMTDVDMYISMEKMIRGGVCVVSERHVRANLPTVAGYDETQPMKTVRYDDANNLYGVPMVGLLPVRRFRWGDATSWSEERIVGLDPLGSNGAFLCVDLDYPATIHAEHNDFPLCPENIEIPYHWLSDYQRGLVSEDKYKPCKKLVTSLNDKRNYWIHYRNLQFVLSHGLKLRAVHSVIEFEQEAFMRPFIEFNTLKRADAVSESEKAFYKLLNNACFGKTMENLRNHRDIQALRPSDQQYSKWVARPSFKSRTILDDDLVIAERSIANLKLNKPMFVGAAVLDLSKLHMWSFWYDYLKPKFGERLTLAMTDTDSLIYSILHDSDISAEFSGGIGSKFDTSDLPANHPLHDTANKKMLGYFKDEALGVPIAELVALRPKAYALRLDKAACVTRGAGAPPEETKKAKGVKKCVVKRDLRFASYLDVLRTRQSLEVSQVGLRSYEHRIYTENVRKTALSPLDTKRYILPDGVHTLAYGHCRLLIPDHLKMSDAEIDELFGF